jgi:arylsulfatase A-like enzyme
MRHDRLSCYGYHKHTSPNIDHLAQKAFVFHNAFSSGPNTPPAFMGIMASQHPFSSKELSVRKSPPTLAEIFRENDYWTQGFNAGNPWVSQYYGYDRGFSELTDFLDLQPITNPGFKFVLNRGKRESVNTLKGNHPINAYLRSVVKRFMPQFLRTHLRQIPQKLFRVIGDCLFYTDHIKVKLEIERQFTPAVTQWIMRNDHEPFFLWIHFMTVHEPYAPPVIDQILTNHSVLWRHSVNSLRREAENVLLTNTMTASYLNKFSNLYDAEIRRVDRNIGKVLRALQKKSVYERSCIILCADHGEEFFEHGGLFHRSKLYNELIKVPLLIHLPDQKFHRSVSKRVGLIDLLPTIAEYLGIDIDPAVYEGESFAEMLGTLPSRQGENEKMLAAEAFYDQGDTIFNFNPFDLYSVNRRMCLHNGKVKFIFDCSGQTVEIYNMERDPYERNDLSKTYPQLKKIAEAMIRKYIRDSERKRIALTMKKNLHSKLKSRL